MDRPLWQIFLNIALLGFAAHRGAVAYMMHLSEAGPLAVAGFALQCVVGVVAAIGVWIGGRWATSTLIALGATVCITALLQAFVVGAIPAAAAVTQVFVALLATAALTYVIRRESKAERRG